MTSPDLDDAKYDRRLKRRLRKSPRRRQRISGPWLIVMLTFTAVTVVLWWGWKHREAAAVAHWKWQHTRAQQLSLQQQQQQQRLPVGGGGNGSRSDGNGRQRDTTTSLDSGKKDDDPEEEDEHPVQKFAKIREYFLYDHDKSVLSNIKQVLREWKELEDAIIRDNIPHETPRWIRPYLLPNSRGEEQEVMPRGMGGLLHKRQTMVAMFSSDRPKHTMQWEEEYQTLVQQHADKGDGEDHHLPGPAVDYTNPDLYEYPDIMSYPDDVYPKLRTLGEMLTNWPQDEDFDGDVITETLLHFNYSDPSERAMAERFRDAELPFKVYDVPDLEIAGRLWTDEYVSKGFNSGQPGGTAQESLDNYFAFYVPENWNPQIHGLPPTRNNDWTYRRWSEHARYADAVRLSASHPHFYWQSGVPASERTKDPVAWSFITRDLRLFSATKANFFVFHPESQKGIQCRFGERGVVAATHFDGGRNMVGMVGGAKRYILSPPNQCSRLGIFTGRDSPIYRHSLLNFGHIRYINDYTNDMSPQEREWLTRASTSQSLETVLKAGEVLYIPSHWFHYIVSLQKSAQCNVRSGMDNEGSPRFGGRADVETCA